MEFGILMVFAMAATTVVAIVYLIIEHHRARYKLDNYGRPPGIKPLTSFVCPACLHRSYAPQHVFDRFCMKCNKSFPKPAKDVESA
jgi:hypothetical protein